VWKLQRVLGQILAALVGNNEDRKGMLTMGALADGGIPSRRQEACAREGNTRASYSSRRLGAHESNNSRDVGTGMGVLRATRIVGLRLAGRRKVSTVWPRRARHVGREDGAGLAVRCKGRGSRCADRRTEAGLGVRAKRAAARPMRDVGAAVML
jgi:hypothetical protein